VAGIAKKVQIFNDTLKLVMVHLEGAVVQVRTGRANSAARIIRLLIASGEDDPTSIAAETIRRLKNAGTVLQAES
jgi:hypothetical protein